MASIEREELERFIRNGLTEPQLSGLSAEQKDALMRILSRAAEDSYQQGYQCGLQLRAAKPKAPLPS